jgi:DNA-binding HxlR family transcriptional regulator
MKRMQESKMVPPIFIGRWTPKVLFSLKEKPYRHGQLRRHIGIVSQHMLTRTLHNLESTGLITRRVTRSKAIAVEYSLTQLGRTLITPLGGMCRWAKRHRRHVSVDVRLEEKHQTRCAKKRNISTQSLCSSRSRDRDCSRPPPRIRASGFPAPGSCLR